MGAVGRIRFIQIAAFIVEYYIDIDIRAILLCGNLFDTLIQRIDIFIIVNRARSDFVFGYMQVSFQNQDCFGLLFFYIANNDRYCFKIF